MSEPQINAQLDLSLPLTPEMAAQVAKARANALAGVPGELRFEVQVKRADGRVEHHTLVGKVDGVA